MVCKVRSPTLATRADPGSGFPITESYNWCGEYAPDKPETVEDAAVVIARQVILGDMTAARGLVDKIKELQT